MAKLNALQEQLLKAGLAKKSKAAEAAREQEKARRGEAPSAAAEIQREAERAREEKIERDRALAAAQKADAQSKAQKELLRKKLRALLPRLAAEKVRERAPEWIVLDNRSAGDPADGTASSGSGHPDDDAYYAQFTVPDDLVW